MKEPFSQAISFETAKKQFVSHVLLALGSNHQADVYLAYAKERLSSLGQTRFSSVFVNDDYRIGQKSGVSHNPDSFHDCHSYHHYPKYSNQCVILQLTTSTRLNELIQQFKLMEMACHRQHQPNNWQVTLDIDVLAIQCYPQQSWLVIDKRYPFKAHEKVGISELFVGS